MHAVPSGDPPSPERCPSCGEIVRGSFCGDCGERRFDAVRDHSLARLFAEFLEGITSLDGRWIRSFRTLLFRPGVLTAEYLRGARVHFLRPVPLFFATSVLFYLFFTNAYAAEFNDLDRAIHGGNRIANVLGFDVLARLHERATAQGLTVEVLAATVRERAGQQSKLFLAALLPAWGALSWLCCRRRSRGFVPHLVFAIHALTVFLLFDLVFLLVLQKVLGYHSVSDVMFAPLLIAFATWLAFALRRTWSLGWLGTLVRAPLLLAGFILALLVYRQLVTITACLGL
ncbi:MAG: DUF3667 domain-containing protein [Planctomycetota bacterium]